MSQKTVVKVNRDKFVTSESLCCVSLGAWISHEKIYMGIHIGIKTTRRKVASIKQFIKEKVHAQGGRAGRFCLVGPVLNCLGTGYLLHLSGLGGAGRYCGVISNGGCF